MTLAAPTLRSRLAASAGGSSCAGEAGHPTPGFRSSARFARILLRRRHDRSYRSSDVTRVPLCLLRCVRPRRVRGGRPSCDRRARGEFLDVTDHPTRMPRVYAVFPSQRICRRTGRCVVRSTNGLCVSEECEARVTEAHATSPVAPERGRSASETAPRGPRRGHGGRTKAIASTGRRQSMLRSRGWQLEGG